MRLDLLLLLSGPGRAWEVTGTVWGWQDHPVDDPFLLDLESFPDEVDPDENQAALEGAMASWSGLGLDLALSNAGETSGAALGADGVFSILHAEYSGMDTVLAFTAAWVWDVDGAAFDCDLVFLDYNDYMDIVWDADPAGPAYGSIDVEAVALHELGHCIGLGHSADESAVMYAYYAGLRELTEDDIDGATALFDAGCADSDGDGVTDCDGDCDDENLAISPAAEEVCDGADNNCNGAVDEAEGAVVALYKESASEESSSWISAGNAFRVDSATTLRSFRQQMSVAEGARLVWSVYRSDDDGETWSLLTERRGEGTTEAWQQSPDLHLSLEAGVVYEASLGVLGELTLAYQRRPDLSPQGPITPLGYVVSRALGDQNGDVNGTWLINQELSFTAVADGDGDGAADCLDPCPEDALDTCDDPVPTDSAETGETGETGQTAETGETGQREETGETGLPDSDPPTETGVGGKGDGSTPGCGCASSPTPGGALGMLLLALVGSAGLRRSEGSRGPGRAARRG